MSDALLRRERARVWAAGRDLFLDDDRRLPERVRYAAAAMLRGAVAAAEEALRRRAAALLPPGPAADAMVMPLLSVYDLLDGRGLLRCHRLTAETVAAARLDWLAERLSAAGRGSDLTGRLLDAEGPVAAAALQLVRAEAAARSDRPAPPLSPASRIRLLWHAAAAIRLDVDPLAAAALGRAAEELCREAAAALRPGPAASAVARVVSAPPDARGAMLVDALGDGAVMLAAAFLAEWSGIDRRAAAGLLLDTDDELLWHALRAAGVGAEDRAVVAAFLAEADPARDLEALASGLAAASAADEATRAAALATLRLPGPMRDAAAALERRGSGSRG